MPLSRHETANALKSTHCGMEHYDLLPKWKSIQTAAIHPTTKLADRVKDSFSSRFWSDDAGYLLDVLDGDQHGAALRPNQIIAISHGLDIISPDRQAQILEVVRNKLLTPGGLRDAVA